jgi:structural maintenance of chromosome 4
MKPKGENEGDVGLLEFLEEIIGTLRYKVNIESTAKDLSNKNIYFRNPS